jgi:FKBP-type peptidyl-prolyl cis-trans isomerase FkpA
MRVAFLRNQHPSRTMRLRRLALLLIPVAFAGCLEGSDPITYVNTPIEQTTFAASLNVDLTQSTKTATGLYYRDLVVGTGAAVTASSTVSVYYDAYIKTGQRFDFKNSPSSPQPFQLSGNQVIAGFREGLMGMKVGGKRQLIIPPELGYGAVGFIANGVTVDPYSVLVFNVELVAVQ